MILNGPTQSEGNGLESQPRRMSKVLTLTLLLLFAVSTASASYWQGIEWREPVDPSSQGMPAHIDDSGTAYLDFHLKLSTFSDENVTLQRKQATEETWSNFSKSLVQNSWNHGQSHSHVALEADDLVFSSEGSISSNKIENCHDEQAEAITVDGNEVSINVHAAYEDTLANESFPDYADVTVDGVTNEYYEGEGFGPDGVIRVKDIFQTGPDGEGCAQFFQVGDGKLDVGQGNWEYRVFYPGKGYSEPIYFDVSSSSGQNIPYVENVSIENKRVFDFEAVTGLDLFPTVTVDVRQLEAESYNLTLIDENGTALGRASVDYSDGVVSRLVQFRDAVKSFVFNSESEQRLAFYDLNYNPWNLQGETERVRLLVEDVADNDYRYTALYEGSTSGTADVSASPFEITALEGYDNSTDTWRSMSEFTSWKQNVSRFRALLNNSVDYPTAELTVTNVRDQESKVLGYEAYLSSTSELRFNSSSLIDDSGEWNYSVYVETSSGARNDTLEGSWTVPNGSLTVEQVAPTGDTTVNLYDTFSWQVRVECSGGECVNEDEILKVWPDPFAWNGVSYEVTSSS